MRSSHRTSIAAARTATWPSTAATARRASSGTDEANDAAFRPPTDRRDDRGRRRPVGSVYVRHSRPRGGAAAAGGRARGGSLTGPLTDPGIGPGDWDRADTVRGGRAH